METAEVISKTKWSVDHAHSEMGFKVKHLAVANVSGIFKEFDADIVTSGDDFTNTKIDFWMNPASIDTGNAERDNHLRDTAFFDTDVYKTIKFKSNSYENIDHDGSYEFSGDLTIKGITNKIKLDVEVLGVMKDLNGDTKAAFIINGKINRKDWGLNWNEILETGGFLLSDDVWICCDLQLTKEIE